VNNNIQNYTKLDLNNLVRRKQLKKEERSNSKAKSTHVLVPKNIRNLKSDKSNEERQDKYRKYK